MPLAGPKHALTRGQSTTHGIDKCLLGNALQVNPAIAPANYHVSYLMTFAYGESTGSHTSSRGGSFVT
jgi:hypothetical protein